MNRKQLTLVIVLGVILGALGWVALKKKGADYTESTARMGDRVLPNFPLNDVSKFVVRQSSNQVTLTLQDAGWVVTDRGGYAANFGNIQEFLRKLWELKIAKPVAVGSSRLPMLSLTPATGTSVELQGKDGKVITTLLLGTQSTKEAGANSPFGGGSFPNGRYVMVGTNLQSIALVSESFGNIAPRAEDWLNKDFFKVEKHKSISVTTTNGTNNWKIARETESGEWKLADAKAAEKLDSGKVSSVNNALSYPSFNDVAAGVKPENAGFDKGVTAVLESFDGFTYTAKTAPKPGGEDYYLQVTVSGNFPKERTPGKDEKPEDKTRLDKEFSDNLKKLEERLKNERKFGDWVYVVSKWTVDPLLKVRHELLEEKKEEKKDEVKDAAAPAQPLVVPPAGK